MENEDRQVSYSTEPSFKLIENSIGSVMLVIDVKQGEPESPIFLYNGEEAVLGRSKDNLIKLVNIPDAMKERLKKISQILVIETENAQATIDSNNQIKEKIHKCYDASVIFEAKKKSQVAPSPLFKTIKTILKFFAWIIFISLVGIGFQIMFSFILGDIKRTYPVTSDVKKGQYIIKKYRVYFLQDHKFYNTIFWTKMLPPTKGKYIYTFKKHGKEKNIFLRRVLYKNTNSDPFSPFGIFMDGNV